MTRFAFMTVLVMLAAVGVASADDTMPTGPLANGASITFAELKIHENNNADLDFPKTDPDSIWHYFNLAHCQCSKTPPANFHEGTFAYLLKLQNPTGMAVNRPLEVWVGSNCNTDAGRPPSMTATCHRIDSAGLTNVDLLTNPGNFRPEISVFDFMTPAPGATACMPAQQTNMLWVLVDTNMNGIPDYFPSQQLATDAQAPPLPTNFRATGGNGAIQISWKSADTADVFAYQALCARADNDGPGKTKGRPLQRYMTGSTLCGIAQSIDLGTGTDIPTPQNAPDAGAPVVPVGGLANLDPFFLCGEQTAATATSLRIEGLQNHVPYKVVFLVVDKYQNASGTYFTSTVTPVPSTDFWQDLHDPARGSNAEGGLCLLAETYGDDSGLTRTLRAFRDDTLGGSRLGRWLTDAYYATLARLGAQVHGSLALRLVAAVALAPLVMFALLWHWLTLPGLLGLIAAVWLWRRRRRLARRLRQLLQLRVVRLAAALGALAFAGTAHAGGGYQPYWENGDELNQNQPSTESDAVTWHVGIRVGPYVPDIDNQLGMTPGPYQQMFGGAQVLPMLDVDRVLWDRFGQLGVGLSLGYMQKTAHTFDINSKPTDNPRMRGADTNKFRLAPAAVTATYRLTWLDDQYGIPVIRVEPDCSQNKALGASLGVTGSIGLAIRAERIDSSAAISMRQSGIQHAGIYGELSLAKVDGFGSSSKLSVGGRTWFAGVDFEF
ncbi:MAG: hypothetical protein E6J90_29830 [Deltaproteobacteria bacterium]|nr:MAG: hypothetical protein E6J90_29830 [Deltaproteobacteria bacterium]